MLVGLQGSGKTTTAVKLALLARREQPPADGRRRSTCAVRPPSSSCASWPSARTSPSTPGRAAVEAIARGRARRRPRAWARDVVILDTAGRLHVDEELMGELMRLKAAVPSQRPCSSPTR